MWTQVSKLKEQRFGFNEVKAEGYISNSGISAVSKVFLTSLFVRTYKESVK